MAKQKSVIFHRDLELPVEQAYDVVRSQTYLCTDEYMESSGNAEIFHSDYTVDEEGVTHAVVHMRTTKEAAHQATNPDVETGQAVAVQPLEEGAFAMHSLVALPGGVGNMRTVLNFAGEVGVGSTKVTAYVEVDIEDKKLGRVLAKRLLQGAGGTVDRGLARIVRMHQGLAE